ncbi:GGDEF domain-containing protein [Chitinibacter sp. S2-10]|uniref:GGDEF domain-containing protein n=1 Tax=Chitinibacter sp. S2-10 TaxID=3373597 RepID=UPI003977A1AC
MEKKTNPTEIAREALKQLALRRLVPTPDNYAMIYHEIAHTPPEEKQDPWVWKLIQNIEGLGSKTPEFKQQIEFLKQLIKHKEWDSVPAQIIRCINSQNDTVSQPWAELIKELVTQWDLPNPAYSAKKKKAGLDKVLSNFGHSGTMVNQKISALIKSWSETASDSEPIIQAKPANSVEFINLQSADQDWQACREALVTTLETGLAPRLSHNPALQQEVLEIATEAKVISNSAELQKWLPRLRKFWFKLELHNDHEDRLADGLMRLLRLLTDNIAEIVVDDDWVRGQIAAIQKIMDKPLDMRVIYDTEAGLKEVMFKQSQLKHDLIEAQTTLKNMLSSFIDRLGHMSENTDKYHGKIVDYASKIDKANSLVSIRHVMEDLMQDTRVMQSDALRTREDMLDARDQADLAHSRLIELENELSQLSEKVRQDQLTGALNRRGLEDAYQIEIARSQRIDAPFSVAMLDIDNFKKLNDRLGHAAGDQALQHLVCVVKELLRPTDTVARYGGEEFVVLMPSTAQAEAVTIMQRVQRELTRRFFLHENEKILITFSAGVTQTDANEARDTVLDRADSAMYRAKKSGKNRVETA